MFTMSKQNQYYSEWNDTPRNDYYRDQEYHGTDSVDAFQPDLGDVDADHADAASYGAAEHYQDSTVDDHWQSTGHSDDDYLTPYHEPQDDEWQSSEQHFDEYLSNDSERGFNSLFDPTMPQTNSDTADLFDDHDRQDPNCYLPSNEPFMGAVDGQTRPSGIQVFDDDLRDCPRNLGGIQIPKFVVAVASACFLGAVGAALSHFSKPDVTAYEIIQMDSYEGLQKAPAIYNLSDLKNSKATIDAQSQDTPTIREIPANDTSARLESRQIALSTTATITPENLSPDSLRVQVWWSNVRETPEQNGAIVTSLPKDTVVNVIGSSGDWYHIQADNEQQPRGFMHRSTVEPAL